MKLNLSHTLRLKFAIWLLLTPLSTVLAGSLNVDGDLTVKNTLTVSGTSIVMTGTDGQPGVSALYTDGTTSRPSPRMSGYGRAKQPTRVRPSR